MDFVYTPQIHPHSFEDSVYYIVLNDNGKLTFISQRGLSSKTILGRIGMFLDRKSTKLSSSQMNHVINLLSELRCSEFINGDLAVLGMWGIIIYYNNEIYMDLPKYENDIFQQIVDEILRLSPVHLSL